MLRQFTATAFILDSQKRVLLMWHKKFNKWMPPGGHMEPNELPEEAAARECKEETGLDVEIVGMEHPDVFANSPTQGRTLKTPIALLLENIPEHPQKGEDAHQHIDFIYLARPLNEDQAHDLTAEEGSDARWFTAEEVEALPESEVLSDVKTHLQHLLKN